MSPRKLRPPTHPARGDFLSCHGSGRFGDTTQGWFVRHFLSHCFFRSSLLRGGGGGRVQTWMFVVHLAHIKCVSHRRVITQRSARSPWQSPFRLGPLVAWHVRQKSCKTGSARGEEHCRLRTGHPQCLDQRLCHLPEGARDPSRAGGHFTDRGRMVLSKPAPNLTAHRETAIPWEASSVVLQRNESEATATSLEPGWLEPKWLLMHSTSL